MLVVSWIAVCYDECGGKIVAPFFLSEVLYDEPINFYFLSQTPHKVRLVGYRFNVGFCGDVCRQLGSLHAVDNGHLVAENITSLLWHLNDYEWIIFWDSGIAGNI